MRDTDLYGRILGIESPWEVTSVELRLEAGEVEVFVARGGGESHRCPECGGAASRHDSRRRRWRHLPTCQYRTILTADVPRVRCAEHGVRTIGVPWSDPGSRFTALFAADRLAARGERFGGGSSAGPELGPGVGGDGACGEALT